MLHLFDTLDVVVHRVLGVGSREGNTISFVFPCERGPFINRFVLVQFSDSCSYELIDQADGESSAFAPKYLTRRLKAGKGQHWRT